MCSFLVCHKFSGHIVAWVISGSSEMESCLNEKCAGQILFNYTVEPHNSSHRGIEHEPQ